MQHRRLVLLLLCSLSLNAQEIPELLQPTQELHRDVNSTAATPIPQASYSQALNQSYSSTVWFKNVSLVLTRDLDGDGYFSQFRLRFDADTSYRTQPVYAVYSLISRGYERVFHTSRIFTLEGGSSTDWFEITSDLVSYPKDVYWMRIQLRDAQTGQLVAEISGQDTAVLDRLYLEEQQFDYPDRVVVVEEGGATGFFAVFLLGLAGYLRRYLRR